MLASKRPITISKHWRVGLQAEESRETVRWPRAPVAVSGAGKLYGNSLWFLWGWSYLSGVGLWLWRLEEWVWQLSHPHRHGRGGDGVLRVHHSIKKSLQIGLRVSPNMDDLVAGRRVVLARIHDSRSNWALLFIRLKWCKQEKLTATIKCRRIKSKQLKTVFCPSTLLIIQALRKK